MNPSGAQTEETRRTSCPNGDGPSLVISTNPLPGEGLAELVHRAAGRNFYRSPSDVLNLAGIPGWRHPSGVAVGAIGHEEGLARVLGVAGGAAVLEPLLCGQVENRAGWSMFHGVHLRDVHREGKRRRVSPRALRISPHGRAIWSIKAFCFDPATMERLLDACPACERPLDFKMSFGPEFCGHCTAVDRFGFQCGAIDLRDFPQEIIHVDDREALSFVTGLVDPDPEIRAEFWPRLPAVFETAERGTLFEFVLALSCALTTTPGWSNTSLERPSDRAGYARFSPQVLATAGRAILDWPDGFHDVADSIRARADERTGCYGVLKELGPLVSVTIDRHVDPRLRAVVREVIDVDMERTASLPGQVRRIDNRHRPDLITVKDAAKRYNTTRKIVSALAKNGHVTSFTSTQARKGPILVSDAEMSRLANMRDDLVPAYQVSTEINIPRFVLPALADRGLIRKQDGPATALVIGTEYYSASSIACLRRSLMERALPDERRRRMPLAKAVPALGGRAYTAWPDILLAAIKGTLPIWKQDKRHAGLARSLAVEGIGSLEPIASGKGEFVIRDDDFELSRYDAALLLGVSAAIVTWLCSSGLLPRKVTPL